MFLSWKKRALDAERVLRKERALCAFLQESIADLLDRQSEIGVRYDLLSRYARTGKIPKGADIENVRN